MLPASVINPFRGCTCFFRPIFPQYKNCGPISQLPKCVEIMLFHVVFIEKNAKDKKCSTEKIFLCHIFTMGALWSIIQTNLGSYSGGLQLSFFLFLEIGHATNHPTTHCMDPDRQNHHDIVFLNLLIIHIFVIFWLQCLSHQVYYFFPHFLTIFTSDNIGTCIWTM